MAFTYDYLLASMDPAYIGPWAPAGNDLPRSGATRGDGRPDNPLSLYGEPLVEAIGLTSVEDVDSRTVALTTDRPTTLLLGAGIPILPEHIWSSVPFAEAVTTFQAEPPVVGSGPFQVVEWQRGRSARFERNPFYWGREPFLEEVQFRFYPDETALLAALRQGEIDYARPVPTDEFDGLDADGDIVGVEGLGAGFTHVAFNTYGAPIDGGGASTAAVRDRRFRDALGYALDPDALIRDALDGHGTPGTTVIPPVFGQFHPEPARPRTYDPDEARQRLDDAGYPDSDGDGVREDQDGAPIDLELYYPTTDSKYRLAARAVETAWERVGIGVTPHGLEPDTLTELLYVPEAGGTAEYDVVLWGWTGSPDPDFLLSLFTTAEIGGYNDSSYANEAYDALFERQRGAPTLEARQAVRGRHARPGVRRRAVPRPLLRRRAARPPHRPLRRLVHPAGRRRRQLLRVRRRGIPRPGARGGGQRDSRERPTTRPDARRRPVDQPLPSVVLPPGSRTPLLVGILAFVGVLSLAIVVRRARRRAAP